MKTILLILIFSLNLFAQNFEIKSLKVYKNKNQINPPILSVKDKLFIEFDIESDTQPLLNILFRFCDRSWEPYDNIFLENRFYNTEHNLWFKTLPATITEARYHYKGEFPNENVTFPFSGKWKFYITDFDDSNEIYATGKFIVVYPSIPLISGILKQRLEGVTLDESTFGQIYNIRTKFNLPDTLFSSRVLGFEIIENQKFEYPIFISEDNTNEYRYFEWNGIDEIEYIVKDIQPGNEYRQANLKDRFKHSPPYTNAQYDGVDVSRLYDYGGKDYNGGSILHNPLNDYSNYMNVEFNLRLPEYFYKNVFLTGSFNNWQVLPEYKLIDTDGLYSINIELKRGIYDYQYVTGIVEDEKVYEIDWLELEGNSWDTENDYYLFVYYLSPLYGQYDKVIGFKKLSSKRK
ncbi:type IX secretion system plug protein domain-containing protein [Bacteroidota bacterium]